MNGENPDIINYRRERRSFKRIRTFKPTHHVFTEQCRQDFSTTKNNVTGEETCSHQKKCRECGGAGRSSEDG